MGSQGDQGPPGPPGPPGQAGPPGMPGTQSSPPCLAICETICIGTCRRDCCKRNDAATPGPAGKLTVVVGYK